MEITDFQPARFHSDLNLPSAEDSILDDAGYAVKYEFRNQAKWQKADLQRNQPFAQTGMGDILRNLLRWFG